MSGGGLVIGWREWITLPDLGVTVKAKVDTGARTSAIHAFDIVRDGDELSFALHPRQHDDEHVVAVTCPLLDVREVRSSSGQVQERYVIKTWAKLHRRRWQIELTLASRDEMGFRMLLGRTAMRGRFLVDPAASYLAGGGEDAA
ncbi:ATP-dependent zinc protease [Euzebya sp.]|uniref:ATP-dependent zinc protease family protein n=1 Tax=Euzebya sp. TaxID=1971409 RepID=UPI0035133699